MKRVWMATLVAALLTTGVAAQSASAAPAVDKSKSGQSTICGGKQPGGKPVYMRNSSFQGVPPVVTSIAEALAKQAGLKAVGFAINAAGLQDIIFGDTTENKLGRLARAGSLIGSAHSSERFRHRSTRSHRSFRSSTSRCRSRL